LRSTARALQARYGLEFLQFVEGLGELNPHTEGRLTL
jgi:hypothetical protein